VRLIGTVYSKILYWLKYFWKISTNSILSFLIVLGITVFLHEERIQEKSF